MVDECCRRGNAVLAGLLGGLGWSISRLVAEVNREMGAEYVSRSTASEWINHFRVPRQPLPTVIAHVLSQARGAPVAVSHLWPGVRASTRWVASDEGMQVPWDLQGTKELLNHWFTREGAMFDGDRRSFMAVSGAALTAPAWGYVAHMHETPKPGMFDQVLGSRYSATKVSPATVEYFQSLVGAFRRMDDLEGGSAGNLKQVGNAIGQVTTCLKSGSFTDTKLAGSMVAVLAQLSQIGGWIAYDAEHDGLAQRYYRTGLHAAHNIGDRDLGAHILGSMSEQAAYRNQPGDAVALAKAAVKTAQTTHPSVRAVVMARMANAHAVNGNAYGFQTASAQVRELFEQARTSGDGPEYLYWLNSAMADAVAGQALLLLTLQPGQPSPKSQLAEAAQLLAPLVSRTGADRPRDAFFHRAWLARAHVKRGDLHQGLSIAQTAVSQMGSIASPRTRKVLRDLDKDLANLRSGRNLREVLELRHQLPPALAA